MYVCVCVCVYIYSIQAKIYLINQFQFTKMHCLKDELKYTPSNTSFQDENNQRSRRRKMIWFNPPYSRNMKTNIVKIFLHLLVKNFPVNNKMHEIFNKNTVIVSYSCMKNMNSIISGHNRNIVNPKQKLFRCNCRKTVVL